MSKSKRVNTDSLAADRSQKGFTLIELLAVMAIIGVLAAVVMTNVDDTQDAGEVAANQQSASALDSAVVDFVAAQKDAEVTSSATVTVVTAINDDTSTSTTQLISSRQPEKFISANLGDEDSAVYNNEFPTAGATTEDILVNVELLDSNGDPISRADFIEEHTAIDVALLEDLGFLTDTLDSATSLADDTFHNFLWTFKKVGSSEDEELDARSIEVFKLITITKLEGTDTVELKYEQFF